VLFRRRYILCGTFRNGAAPRRVELDATRPSDYLGGKLYLAAEPAWPSPGVTRRVALYPEAAAKRLKGCPRLP